MTAETVRTDGSDPFGRSEFLELAEEQAGTCVSLYLPTHRAGPEVDQDPVRFKNLLSEARAELAALGSSRRDIDDLLAPGDELVADRRFWRHQAEGLAVFMSRDVVRTFRVATPFDELGVVSTRFHLRPMLPLLTGDEGFWLLALSQNEVRLFEASRHTIDQVDLGDTPTNMADALAHEDPEKHLQVLSSGPSGAGQFHGHGGGGEDDKAALERYFRAVDRGLAEILGAGGRPLVIAGVTYYGPIFRKASRYAHVLEPTVGGNPEGQSAIELHELAWPLVESELVARRESILERYRQEEADGRGVSGNHDVAAASGEGRVETLILPLGQNMWAPSAEAPNAEARAEREFGDLDLLDVAAVQVLSAGGDVAVVESGDLPGGDVAAILRYATVSPA